VITFYSYKGGTGRSSGARQHRVPAAGEGHPSGLASACSWTGTSRRRPAAISAERSSSAEIEHRYADDELVTKRG
jgi:hypothetical protein